MKKKRFENDVEIIFKDDIPLMTIKSELDELVEIRDELELELNGYRKAKYRFFFLIGMFSGVLFSLLIILILFVRWL